MHQYSQDDPYLTRNVLPPSPISSSPPMTPRSYARPYPRHSAHHPPSMSVPFPKRPLSFAKPHPPPVQLLLFKIFIILSAATFIISSLVHDRRLSTFLNLRLANPRPNDLCHIVGTNPRAQDIWQFNARSLCLMSHVCIAENAVMHSSNLHNTQCQVLSPMFQDRNVSFPALIHWVNRTCAQFQTDFVLQEQGVYMREAGSPRPTVEQLPPAERHWVEEVSVIVPYYPWPWNIFHFVNIVADLFHVVQNLDALLDRWGRDNVHSGDEGMVLATVTRVNVLFQGPKRIPYTDAAWQHELLQLARKQMEKRFKVSFYYMEDMGRVCMRNAVMLGRRGHDNLWPFLNESDIAVEGRSVPKDAIAFKQMVYDGLGISAILPDRGVSEPPPFLLGYAKREGKPDENGFYRYGAGRRFSDLDEKWFHEMLRNETDTAGAGFVTIESGPDQDLKTQVEQFAAVGFAVGIHGANLVNTLFVKPFGVLMEVLPKGTPSRCYMSGLNSGLKYLRFESSEEAGLDETGCELNDTKCGNLRNRMVKVSTRGDRERLRGMVRDGLAHLKSMQTRYQRGVPVRYNKKSLRYEISGS